MVRDGTGYIRIAWERIGRDRGVCWIIARKTILWYTRAIVFFIIVMASIVVQRQAHA